MNTIRTNIENNNDIKKDIEILVFQSIRSYNINHKEKIIIKGGKLYNLLTDKNNSFDIDVIYNGNINDFERINNFFLRHFEKHKKDVEMFKNISIKNKIFQIENKTIIKYSMMLYGVLVPFFEITFGEEVDKYWMYSYGIYCILPSRLITNLMDMANQNTFHKRFVCRERLLKLINYDYLKFNYNMDRETYNSECDFLSNIPRGITIILKSEQELLNNGYKQEQIKDAFEKIRKMGNLEKYAFLKNFQINLNYKLKEYENYIDIFNDTEENKSYEENNLKYLTLVDKSTLNRYCDLTIQKLLEIRVLNLGYINDKYREKVDIHGWICINSRVISPIYTFSVKNKLGHMEENGRYCIRTNFHKSNNPYKKISIPKFYLGLKPTMYVIIPDCNNRNNNVATYNGTNYFISNVECVKKREIYYKVCIDKLTLLEKMNLVILREIIE